MTKTWTQTNQTHLTTCINQIKTLLKLRINNPSQPFPQTKDPPSTPTYDTAELPAIEALCILFDLSPFEKQLIVLCAAHELDSDVKTLIADVQGNPGLTYPTFA
jgi:hypothetical protein